MKLLFHSIVYIILIALISFSGRNSMFPIIGFAIGATYILLNIKNKAAIANLFFFFLPFAPVFKVKPDTTSFFTVWELIVFFLCIKDNKNRHLLTKSIMLFAYLVSINLLNSSLNIFNDIKFFLNISIVIFILSTDLQDNYKEYFLLYISGFIVASELRLYASDFLQADMIIANKAQMIGGELTTRFSAFYADPNYYLVNLNLGIILLSILYYKHKINILLYGLGLSILVYLQAQTASKSGLFILPIDLFFILVLFYNRSKILFLIVGLALIVLLMNLSLENLTMFSNTIDRIGDYNDMSTLTTERNIIWLMYYEYFVDNPLFLFVGRGLSTNTLYQYAAHNTYIDILYQTGIIGFFFIFYLLSEFFHHNKALFKRSIFNYSAIVIIMIQYFFLSELQFFDPPFHISLAIIIYGMDINPLTESETSSSPHISDIDKNCIDNRISTSSETA